MWLETIGATIVDVVSRCPPTTLGSNQRHGVPPLAFPRRSGSVAVVSLALLTTTVRAFAVSQREDIVKYGGIGALIAVLEKHQSSEDLVRMTCDVIYHLAKHDGPLCVVGEKHVVLRLLRRSRWVLLCVCTLSWVQQPRHNQSSESKTLSIGLPLFIALWWRNRKQTCCSCCCTP